MLTKGKIDEEHIHSFTKNDVSGLSCLHSETPKSKLCRRRYRATSPGGRNRRFTYNFQAPLQGTYVVEMIQIKTQLSTHVENY